MRARGDDDGRDFPGLDEKPHERIGHQHADKASGGKPWIAYQPGSGDRVDHPDESTKAEIDITRRDDEELADRRERQGESGGEDKGQPESRKDAGIE